MALFEEVVLEDSIEIKTTAAEVFNFLTSIVDDDTYRAWHKEDHVSFRWLKGEPWVEGSVIYAEEYIHGKLHKLKFKITKIVPNKRIEYIPVSCFVRKFFPKNEFIIEQRGESCLFTALGTYRVGKIGKIFFKEAIEKGLSGVKEHMRKEGENLKDILELK
ncbi:MAG: SRPBCC family protein [Pseudomonadota bacterium]